MSAPAGAEATDRTRSVLEAGLDAAGPDLAGPRARQRLLQYTRLLARWNRTYNLTAVTDPEEMVCRHLLDCLAILPHVRGPRLLDVGTGAGLPGIVLAAADPDLRCVLLDSSGKKTRFCRHAAAELGLANVEVVRSRVEEYRRSGEAGGDGGFDTVVARAWTSLERAAALAGPLLAVRPGASGGRLLLMKGRRPDAELEALGPMRENARVVRLQIPGLAAERHLVIIPAEAFPGSEFRG